MHQRLGPLLVRSLSAIAMHLSFFHSDFDVLLGDGMLFAVHNIGLFLSEPILCYDTIMEKRDGLLQVQ